MPSRLVSVLSVPSVVIFSRFNFESHNFNHRPGTAQIPVGRRPNARDLLCDLCDLCGYFRFARVWPQKSTGAVNG